MAKAKATSAEKEPKQIVLTEEQYETLCKILSVIDDATDEIDGLASTECSPVELGYNLGMINSELQNAYNSLDELTDDINPNKDWFNDEDENEDEN